MRAPLHSPPAAHAAAASQIAYSSVDSRWVMPDHVYSRTFHSASGAVSVQVVQVDSTPLHDRYLFSGASGGGYATNSAGVADRLINNVGGNIVINSGVTTANGWTPANGCAACVARAAAARRAPCSHCRRRLPSGGRARCTTRATSSAASARPARPWRSAGTI
jgi:hypothetical protein